MLGGYVIERISRCKADYVDEGQNAMTQIAAHLTTYLQQSMFKYFHVRQPRYE